METNTTTPTTRIHPTKTVLQGINEAMATFRADYMADRARQEAEQLRQNPSPAGREVVRVLLARARALRGI
jgi:hypothetical protein